MPQATRRRALINAPTFSVLAFLLEFGAVLALALVTGVLYHLVAYGSVGSIGFYLQVGVLGAAVYAIANTARGDYRLGNFLGGKVNTRRMLIHWHATFLCLLAAGFLAQLSVIYSRAWIALFYVSGLLLLVPIRRAADAAPRSMRAASASSPPRRSSSSARRRASARSCSATGRRSSASKSRAAASCRCCPAASARAAPRSSRASSNTR